MKVILDTNIIVNNYYFNTPKFIGLFGYIEKTRSKLIIPDFVFQEVNKKYKEELEKYIEKQERDSRILFNKNEKIDIFSLLKNYNLFWLKLASDNKITVPTSKNFNTKKLFERALKTIPPFDSSGRGIRDTLIWLSIVDMIKKNPKEYFCFISANTKDFGELNLYPQLFEDLGKNSSRLIYFNSLEEFLSSYGDKIAFIDNLLIQDFLNKQDDYLLPKINIDRISRSDIEGLPRNCDIDSIEEVSISSIDIDDFYIYSSTKNFYKVQVEVIIYIDVRILTYDSNAENEYGYSSAQINGSTFCFADISLLINKKTKEITINEKVSNPIYYP